MKLSNLAISQYTLNRLRMYKHLNIYLCKRMLISYRNVLFIFFKIKPSTYNPFVCQSAKHANTKLLHKLPNCEKVHILHPHHNLYSEPQKSSSQTHLKETKRLKLVIHFSHIHKSHSSPLQSIFSNALSLTYLHFSIVVIQFYSMAIL